MDYKTELVKATDFVTKPCPNTEDKYVVECGYCGKKFKSMDVDKALEREGKHRANQHVNKYTKITTAKADYDPTYSILEEWFTVQLYNIDLLWYTIPGELFTMFSQTVSFPKENLDKPVSQIFYLNKNMKKGVD